MNQSKNLIVALLALWCYAHNSNINLANNATMLLVLYALLTGGNRGLNMQSPLGMSTTGTMPIPMQQVTETTIL